MIRTELIALVQSKAQESKANERLARIERKIKIKNAVIGTILTAFFIAGLGIVGNNDFESEIAMARETATEAETGVLPVTHTSAGEVFYKNIIETERGYLWDYETGLPEGTEVTVYFNDAGTETPLDDVVLEVLKR